MLDEQLFVSLKRFYFLAKKVAELLRLPFLLSVLISIKWLNCLYIYMLLYLCHEDLS